MHCEINMKERKGREEKTKGVTHFGSLAACFFLEDFSFFCSGGFCSKGGGISPWRGGVSP